jgi:hypothetical protein
MRHKILILFLALFIGLGNSFIYAQSLIVVTKTGQEFSEPIISLQKFSFSNNQLLLGYKNNTTDSYNISEISKLYFKPLSTANFSFNENTLTMAVYPNPAKNNISILNAPQIPVSVFIYRMDGKMVGNTIVSSVNPSVNISNLKSGIYILKVNDQVFKLIKL